ncbi:response regulator transcription factor [Sporolactobacillus shoreae]|uniref:Response regulator transcription factor n=1 Tax=Sporolactobacillus shoreae TaxID=1465501 RepID=A0A4Z0GT59_9BACL|nr:response regulator transcription factor [Sporolactobacillus shoreae]TGA99412.1 response regulator transcription factor [Sporolactobacillus shoreae]
MFTILVVEDDPTMKEIIVGALEKWHFEGIAAIDFDHILQTFIDSKPQLVLLDINLPAFDGYFWCRKLREISKVPIIFISSRDTRMDKIMAMNMGGDDFIQKPIDMDILMAKINALLRRTYSYLDHELQVVEHRGAVLNLKDSRLIYDDCQIDLTKNEFRILYMLMTHAGEVLSRDKIMRALWEDESFVDDNTLTVNVVRLRKKLAEAGLESRIKTKKGQGYFLE